MRVAGGWWTFINSLSKIILRLKALTDLFARVKWKSVLLLLLLVVLSIAILWVLFSFKPFGQSYKGEGVIQVRSWADPVRVDLSGKSTAKVEIKNKGEDNADVLVKLETYDSVLSFDATGNQKVNETVSLGHGESRELRFKVLFNATHGGTYGLKVAVSPKGENIVDEIFFDVFEK